MLGNWKVKCNFDIFSKVQIRCTAIPLKHGKIYEWPPLLDEEKFDKKFPL